MHVKDPRRIDTNRESGVSNLHEEALPVRHEHGTSGMHTLINTGRLMESAHSEYCAVPRCARHISNRDTYVEVHRPLWIAPIKLSSFFAHLRIKIQAPDLPPNLSMTQARLTHHLPTYSEYRSQVHPRTAHVYLRDAYPRIQKATMQYTPLETRLPAANSDRHPSLTTTWGAAARLAVLKKPKLPSMNQYLAQKAGLVEDG